MTSKISILLITFMIVVFIACERIMQVNCPGDDPRTGENIAVEQDYVPQVVKCIWFDDKPAAYTIAFDDARASHYQVSAPTLFDRGIRGTFYIHTQYIADWSAWQRVADMGHEIGSHSWSHPKMTELTENLQRLEFEKAIADIKGHLSGIKSIPSFAYPYGLFNDALRRVLRDYHVVSRGGGGLNPYNLTDEDLTLVHGIGVYPPYNMSETAGWVNKAIDEQAWSIVYFHSVSAQGDSNDTTIPVNRFIQHLDFVQSVRDSLWIAPQGEVANYVRIRRDGKVIVKVVNQTSIELALENLPSGVSDISSLTVKMPLPRQWHGEKVVAHREDGTAHPLRTGKTNIIYFSVPSVGKIVLEAKKVQ
jgi:peptidoglycan/xylan/chitin deacetylase (PgdA/CDA1 family)